MDDYNADFFIEEALNEEIVSFVSKCGPWVSCYATSDHFEDEQFLLKIILQNNTLTQAFLYITSFTEKDSKKTDLDTFLVPISHSSAIKYNSTDIMIRFENYKGFFLIFHDNKQKNDKRQFEAFISQYQIAMSLSENPIEDSVLATSNQDFLNKYAPSNEALANLELFDQYSLPCIVSPIIYDANEAYETWSTRNREMNASRITQPQDLKISCLTWNVGGCNPSHNKSVLHDLSVVAHSDYDIYFFAFEEIDMSFSSVVVGKSQMADEWTKVIEKAFIINPDEINQKHSKKKKSHHSKKSHSKTGHCGKAVEKRIFNRRFKFLSYQAPELQNNSIKDIHPIENTQHTQNSIPPAKQTENSTSNDNSPTFDFEDIEVDCDSDFSSDSDDKEAVTKPQLKPFHPDDSNSMKSESKEDSALDDENIKLNPVDQSKQFIELGYTLIQAVSLGGVFVAVVIRNQLSLPIIFDKPRKYRLGHHGMTANKSAIVIPAKIGDFIRLNFVGCHLCAHQGNTHERNQELRFLLRNNIRVYKSVENSTDEIIDSSQYMRQCDRNTGKSEKVDYLILMGDLNYRIDMTYDQCMQYLREENFDALLEKDQLNMVKKRDNRLALFDEANISFRPTYKYDKNANIYDTSEKHRVPSYTDRVLVATNCLTGKENDTLENADNEIDGNLSKSASFLFESDIIHNLYHKELGFDNTLDYSLDYEEQKLVSKPKFELYRRIENGLSDHRPVQCVVSFQFLKTIPNKLAEFELCQAKKYNELVKLAIPTLEPKKNKIELQIKEAKSITLKNNSVAWANWHAIIDNSNISNNEEQEVQIAPSCGTILPNQSEEFIIVGLKKTQKGQFSYTKTIYIASYDDRTLATIEVIVN